MRSSDPLYALFEQYLYNALVEEETTEDFLERVVKDYLSNLGSQGAIAREHLTIIESDLKEEVLEMLRKKTYGHYNLASFRNSHKNAKLTAPPEKVSKPSKPAPLKRRRSC